MTNHNDSHNEPTALEDLVTQLLGCGAVLSQMISGMVEFEASGRSAPDAAPIPEVAHSLIHSVATDVAADYSEKDIRTAARLTEDVTNAVCENIFIVDPDLM